MKNKYIIIIALSIVFFVLVLKFNSNKTKATINEKRVEDFNDSSNKASEAFDLKEENFIKPNINDTSDFLVDSTNIGIKKKTKIELLRVNYTDSSIVSLKLFKRVGRKWKQTSKTAIETWALNELDPKFEDFNNDGFQDLLITSGTAARGANTIQTLFLYHPQSNSLKWIKNSENYPNLELNKNLKCINSFIVTASYRTVFLRIQNDSLVEFAEVFQSDGRIIVTLIDKEGKHNEIKNIIDEGFSDIAKFKNYNPLME